MFVSFVSSGQTAEDYFNSGQDKSNKEDYYGAIADFNKAIELTPDYPLDSFSKGST